MGTLGSPVASPLHVTLPADAHGARRKALRGEEEPMTPGPEHDSSASRLLLASSDAEQRRTSEVLAGARAAGTRPHRVGRINITGYFAPSVKQSIRLIQAKYPDRTVQELLSEALNDLFRKYDVPQTADSEK
jgi:hypothetical protein